LAIGATDNNAQPVHQLGRVTRVASILGVTRDSKRLLKVASWQVSTLQTHLLRAGQMLNEASLLASLSTRTLIKSGTATECRSRRRTDGHHLTGASVPGLRSAKDGTWCVISLVSFD
jgi:hypothetical protein